MNCRNAVRLRTVPHAVNRSLQSKTLCLPFSVTRDARLLKIEVSLI